MKEINEDKIFKAAEEFAQKYYPAERYEEQHNVFKEGFVSCPIWAQEEFLKTLWYSPEIEPKRGKDIIAISQKGEAYTFCYHALSAIQKSFHDCNIERWCYLSDILPKEGGEE